MGDINRWMLSGEITKDPQVRQTSGGKDYLGFVLTYYRGYGKTAQKSTVLCQAYGRTMDYIKRYALAGSKVLVGGELALVTKKVDGKFNTSAFLTVNDCVLVGVDVDESAEEKQFASSPSTAPRNSESPALPDEDDEELPF